MNQPEAAVLRSLELAPIAYAATRGSDHELFFANVAFRRLAKLPDGALRRGSFRETFPHSKPDIWLDLLESAMRGAASVNAPVPPLTGGAKSEWACTVWPVERSNGDSEYCVMEVHETALPDHTLLDVAEQLLLSALRESEAAGVAQKARREAEFLANATQRLTESLDIETTLTSIASIALLALPTTRNWCVIDVVTTDGAMRRVAIVHPDENQHAVAAALCAGWHPESGDFFGLPLALRTRRSQVISHVSDDMLRSVAHTDENLELLHKLGFVSLLIVPLIVRKQVIGAVSFIKGMNDAPFTEADIKLAETVSSRSALALDNAQLYGQSQKLRTEAESANRAKSEFLKHMSHELRTPLNAILGYVDLIDMELHGPVTGQQRSDLDRIRQSNHHLLMLITDILDYTQLSSGATRYTFADFDLTNVIREVDELLQTLASKRKITTQIGACDRASLVHADVDRVQQIIINLVANAIKYSPPGSHVRIECLETGPTVQVKVTDNGAGIPADQLDAIFEPFKQVGPVYTRTEGGVGLGLAISRDLALGMNGTLTVESTLGAGSCFTLTLPRAS